VCLNDLVASVNGQTKILNDIISTLAAQEVKIKEQEKLLAVQ